MPLAMLLTFVLLPGMGTIEGSSTVQALDDTAKRYTYDKPSDALKPLGATRWALKAALAHWDVSKFYDSDGEGGEFSGDQMEWNLRFVLGVSRFAESQIRNQLVVFWASALLAYQWTSFDPGEFGNGEKPSTSGLQNIYLRFGARTWLTQALAVSLILSYVHDLAPDDEDTELQISDLQNAIVSYLTVTYVASQALRVFLVYDCARRFADNDFRQGALGNFGLGFKYQLVATQSIIMWAGLATWYQLLGNSRFDGEKIDNSSGYVWTIGPALYLTFLQYNMTVALTGSRNEYGSRIGIFGIGGKNFLRPAKDFALSFIIRV